jgi:HEAT repeat protein
MNISIKNFLILLIAVLMLMIGCSNEPKIDNSALRTEAFNMLVETIKNGSLEERQASTTAASALRDETAVEILKISVEDQDQEIADKSMRKITLLKQPSTKDMLRAELGDSFDQFLIEALIEFGANDLDANIEKGLKSLRPNERAAAVELLGKYKKEAAAERIRGYLNDEELIVRIKAVHALGRLGDKPILAKVGDLFKEDNVISKAGAVAIAEDLDLREYEPQVVDVAKNAPPLIAIQALRVLYKWKNKEASDILLEKINTKDMMNFYAYLKLADDNKEKKVLEKLRELTSSSSPQERYSAARVYISIDPENSSDILDFLLKGMDSDIDKVREQAAILLGNLPGIQKVKTTLVEKGLKDPSAGVINSSIFALGKIGDQDTLKYLVPIMQDKNSINRLEASAAILKILDRIEGKADNKDEDKKPL